MATDFRLWVRDAIDETLTALGALREALLIRAEEHADSVMPGFTHLQSAQPVTLGHHLMAYHEMIVRDASRFADARARMNQCPLGSAALAGTGFPIDRHMTAEALGFDAPTRNSLDAVSDRDFAIDYLQAATNCSLHLSRLAEEFVLWASQPFGFVALSDQWSTGSSIMPQKRNPDAAELVRGHAGRIMGCMTSLMVTMKGLPLAYSKDMQDDKPPVFEAHDLLALSIAAMTGMVESATFRTPRMRAVAEAGFSTATDLADWLVRVGGIPFREAHHITGRAVKLAEEKGVMLHELSIDDLTAIDARINDGIYDVLSVDASVASRVSFGGTAPANVRAAIATARGCGLEAGARPADRVRPFGLWRGQPAATAQGRAAAGRAARCDHPSHGAAIADADPQQRPQRSDELMTQSQERRSDEFDLPPLMDHFHFSNGELHVEDVPVARIAAEVGTPVYIYSASTFRRHAQVFREGLSALPRVHLAYAIKANPNLAVLRVLADEGYGADVVSVGEMRRALAAGMKAEDIVFSGVGKTRAELIAALEAGIGQFNLELEEEGAVLAELAHERGLVAPATLRVNPDVDAGTHAKISTGRKENKFGVPIDQALGMFDRLAGLPGIDLKGVACHIGSQLGDLAPLEAAYKRVGELVAELRGAGHRVTRVDLGGGLGVPYKPGDVMPAPAAYGEMVARVTKDWDVELMFEPGRVIAGNAGVLATEVVWVKPGVANPYVIVDAAMNDLARPALYDAYHDFVAVKPTGETMMANIAGPVCETGDTFAMNREIDVVKSGDLAVFRTAGAYGATMASTYNSRPLVPEVMVEGDRFAVVADRIAAETIIAAERVPEWLKK